MSADLATKHCIPCSGAVPPLDLESAQRLLGEVTNWILGESPLRLSRRFTFADFVSAMRFVNEVADLAEAEGHHPDIAIHYNQVDLDIWTHAVKGLTESDFILAAKINAFGS
jgi:4a-hydroxytetrahydrobiopterin dehydratase